MEVVGVRGGGCEGDGEDVLAIGYFDEFRGVWGCFCGVGGEGREG